MDNLTLGMMVDTLKKLLDCPAKKLANLTGLDPHTLSNNRDELFTKLTPRTHQRLGNLYAIAIAIGPLRPEIMLATLERHTYRDHKGRMDSVSSALKQDKYDLALLKIIAEKAKKELTDEWTLSYPQVTESELSVSI